MTANIYSIVIYDSWVVHRPILMLRLWYFFQINLLPLIQKTGKWNEFKRMLRAVSVPRIKLNRLLRISWNRLSIFFSLLTEKNHSTFPLVHSGSWSALDCFVSNTIPIRLTIYGRLRSEQSRLSIKVAASSSSSSYCQVEAKYHIQLILFRASHCR